MTTVHTDVLVLGSGVGALTAGSYLALAGLRVVLLEEEALVKRPPILREPFLLSGLESGGAVRRVIQELTIPLIEQRRIRHCDVALQLLLPEARIDVRRGRAALAREFAAYGIADAAEVLAWLLAVDTIGERIRAGFMPQAKLDHGPALVRRLVERSTREQAIEPEFPAPPPALRLAVGALLAPLSGLSGAADAGSALIVCSTRDGGFLMPSAGDPFIDMLRRRFLSLHGEIQTLNEFSLRSGRGEVGVEFARGSLFGRAMVIGAPLELIKDAGPEQPPRWFPASTPPSELGVRLFRAHRDALPVGLAARAVVTGPEASQLHWISRHPDGDNPEIEWIVISGPGAQGVDAAAPLGPLNPFPGGEIVEVDLGPSAIWDRDQADLRFFERELPVWLRQRPPVALVGSQVSPVLGFEGEILGARRVALRLIEKLGSPKI